MRQGGPGTRTFGQFTSALLLAAAAATMALVVLAQLSALTTLPRQWVWEAFPFGVFGVALVVAVIGGALPASVAFAKDIGALGCSFLGLLTAVVAITVVRVLFAGPDPTSGVMWRTVFDEAGYLPAFGLAGAIGGAVFRLVSRAYANG